MTEKVKWAHQGADPENKIRQEREQLNAAASRKQQVEAELDPGGVGILAEGREERREEKKFSKNRRTCAKGAKR